MLNVFKYFDAPNELNRSELKNYIPLLDQLAGGELQPSDKSLLAPVMHLIKRSPRLAMWYAAEILQQRWSEAEPVIMQDPNKAYWYTRHVIKERWPEAEPIIMKDPLFAYKYARWVIRGRWIDAELYIQKDPEQWSRYAEFFKI